MRRHMGLMVFLLATVFLIAACVEDPQGPKEDTGGTDSRGLQGEPGPQGIQGEPGTQGVQGEPGPQGIQGEGGEPGPRGDKGDKGESPSEDELIKLLNQIVNPPIPTPEPLEGSYQAPNPRFVFSYTTKDDEEEIGGLDIYLISDPVFDHPGCPAQAEVFGQSARGDSVRCRFNPLLLLTWVKEFSLASELPEEGMEWGVYATLTPYQEPWPVPEEAQGPKPRFLVQLEAFGQEHSGNILLTVFPKGKEPTPRCPDQADKGNIITEGETEYYRCIASPVATLAWLQKFSLVKDLPPREEWEETYAIFPAIFPWET